MTANACCNRTLRIRVQAVTLFLVVLFLACISTTVLYNHKKNVSVTRSSRAEQLQQPELYKRSEATSSQKLANDTYHLKEQHQPLTITWKPLVIEIGTLALFQAIGLPLFGRLGLVFRRINLSRHLQRTVRVPQQLARSGRVLAQHGQHVWKAAGSFYKKTSLSKIVQRSKKLVKVFKSDHHEEE
jgi:hypothetical protein